MGKFGGNKNPLTGNPYNYLTNGGEGGIRTHGRLAPTPDFESGTFDHSATSPTHIELYLAPVLNLKEVLTRILC